MKTIREWYEDLPKESRDKALKNTPKDTLDDKEASLSEALEGAFFWRSSPEGFDYWETLYVKSFRA